MTIAHYLIARPLGFIFSTILLLAAIPYYLGFRRIWVILFVSVTSTLVVYYLFKGFFYIPLPEFSLF